MNKEKMQDIKERLDLFPSNMNEPAQKAYCELFDYIENLEQQCKKQKEVIDKAIEFIKENKDKYYQDWGQDDSSVDIYLGEYEIKELLDILKEVSE